MEVKDIRWIQRYNNFKKALNQLTEAVELSKTRLLTRLEQQGLIHIFEYTHELAWNTIKDLLEYRGNSSVYGSRDAARVAFKLGIIENGEIWMDMIISRIQSSHTYDEKIAESIVREVIGKYILEFMKMEKTFEELVGATELSRLSGEPTYTVEDIRSKLKEKYNNG